MTTPKRIQRKRTAGWRMPEGAVYVGRPTKWGNPFKLENESERQQVVEAYRDWIEALIRRDLFHDLNELRGKNLACFCPLDKACHADVLLELANSAPDTVNPPRSESPALDRGFRPSQNAAENGGGVDE